MSHNITVNSGKSIRLLTSGKYCDRDIIVTAIGGGSTDDSVVGTWVFNETLPLIDDSRAIYFKFQSGGNNYDIMQLYNMGDWMYLVYENSDDNTYTDAYDDGWRNEVYRIITITEEPTDPEFITWLKANAVKRTSYEDGYADGVNSALAGYVDWNVTATADSCEIYFYNNHPTLSVFMEFEVYLRKSEVLHNDEIIIPPNSSFTWNVNEMNLQSISQEEWEVYVNGMRFINGE